MQSLMISNSATMSQAKTTAENVDADDVDYKKPHLVHFNCFLVRCLVTIIIAFFLSIIYAQANSIALPADTISHLPGPTVKPEIFTSGFIDLINSGQVNASARFIRLFIGEPGHFTLLFIYSRVSANRFQNPYTVSTTKANDRLFHAYTNPFNGLVNFSSEGTALFNSSHRLANTGWLWHVESQVLTAYRVRIASDPMTGRPTIFFNHFVASGTYFQTGAWERSHIGNKGILWLAARYHACYSDPGTIQKFLPGLQTSEVYTGYSLGFGIAISELVNSKVIYYKYIKQPEIGYALPLFQFSFSYSMK